jgi:hypothetical protein
VTDDIIENAGHYQPLLDDDVKCTPLYGLRLFVYLDEEGQECTAWKVDGNVRAAHVLGNIEWLKHEMIHRHCADVGVDPGGD